MRKKWIYLSIVPLVASVFFSHARVFAVTPVETYIAELSSSNKLKTSAMRVDEIISSYCSAVLSSPGFIQNGFVYNAKQSAFVHLLCRNAGDDTSSYFTDSSKEDKYFKLKTFKQLGFTNVVDGNDLCNPMDNDCDIFTLVPTLFDNIITDYVNMKQANFYGLVGNFTGDEGMESQINMFSQAYFDIKVCDKDINRYPSTCRAMKGYLKNARNLLSDVTIFNAQGILDMVIAMADKNAKANREKEKLKPSPTIPSCTGMDLTKDIFLCGLYGDTAAGLVSFTNLTYNELFYYRFFMGYYFMMLQKTPSILMGNTRHKNIDILIKESSNQYLRSRDALSLTFRLMRDTYMAYPFHVGFLMYQEDLDGFGKLLAKITTPIYTLYDKLRHVQTK